jgi:hypothetical protein
MSITSQVLLLFIWYVWWVHWRSDLNSSFSIQLVWHMYRCPWMPNMIAPADPSKIRWFIIRFWLSRRAFYQAVLFTLSMLVSRRRRIEEGDEQDCAAQGMNEAVEAVEAFMCTVLATGMERWFFLQMLSDFFFAWSTFWCFLHVSIVPPYLWTLPGCASWNVPGRVICKFLNKPHTRLQRQPQHSLCYHVLKCIICCIICCIIIIIQTSLSSLSCWGKPVTIICCIKL